MSDFDPYQQWLGIPPSEQPPDHYRLLGLRRFEPDLNVIQTATDDRMVLVRVYQTGPRAPLTQKLLNELATAKLCLLNPYSKAEYDASLAIATTGTAQTADNLLPVSMPAPVARNSESAGTSIATAPLPASPYVSPARAQTRGPTAKGDHAGWWLPVLGILAMTIVGMVVWGAKTIVDRDAMENQPTKQSAGGSTTVVPVNSRGSDSSDKSTLPDESSLILQEANGSVVFPMSAAALRGQIAMGSADVDEFLVGWGIAEDQAAWRFKIEKLPSQGIFRVRVGYQSASVVANAEYVLSVDGKSAHAQDVRASERVVEDEFYLAVPSGGEHTLTFSVRNLPQSTPFGLKLLEFSVPRTTVP